jgi:ubiquinone/menaquinone biosynthesis C-methylase UbiE
VTARGRAGHEPPRHADPERWLEQVNLTTKCHDPRTNCCLTDTSGATLKGRIQRVSDGEMAAINAVESVAPSCSDFYMEGGTRFYRDTAEIGERLVSQMDRTREHLIETYRKKAKHYDITSRFYPVPGYPERAQRLRAVQALGLRRGDSVVDVACGTGLNFALIEEVIGPDGRIVGVDLTDAMLARAQDRIKTHGWSNISLVQADAADFNFPTGVDAILSTYALTQVPECGEVIAHGAGGLSEGGRWVVLDLKIPANVPRWLVRLGTGTVRPFASIDQWIMRRPWEVIRAAMREELADLSWIELVFGTAFLAAGSRGPRTVDGTTAGDGHE